MGVSSPTPTRSRKARGGVSGKFQVIDFSLDRRTLSDRIVKACDECGFFRVVNHGIPEDVVSRLEEEGADFFAKPLAAKQQARGSGSPFGYGCNNIGFNGDVGELEYLLLRADPLAVAENSKSISPSAPTKFSNAVDNYVRAVRDLACDILDIIAEGLRVRDKCALSRLIRDVHSDSLLRINHYPPSDNDWDPSSSPKLQPRSRVGFGEHSDPQVLTILRSNDVGGLQICMRDGRWVPVPPNPNEICVLVGDALQALTNGRFASVRHRAMATETAAKPRMSVAYFGAPPLGEWISALPEMVTPLKPVLYRPFTWAEYKKAVYSLRLGDYRLNRFKA